MIVLDNIKKYFKKNRTHIIFLKFRAVLLIGFLTMCTYFALFFVLIKYWDKDFISSLAELVSVFVGITLGFYWNKADEAKTKRNEFKRAFRQLLDELKKNQPKLRYLYTGKYNNNLILLLKTTNWEICKYMFIDIPFDVPNEEIFMVRDIYHKIQVINYYVEKYPFKKDMIKEDYDELMEIIKTVKVDINNWIITISEFYGWENGTKS